MVPCSDRYIKTITKMRYFTVKELCVSDNHPKLVVVPKKGTAEYTNIVSLIENLLDPVREKTGKPIRVSSGYRPPALNKAVGGSSTSNHVRGCAADCTTGSTSADNLLMVRALIELGIRYDECIIEGATFNNQGEITGAKWIHLAYRRDNNRMKLLWTKDMKTYSQVKVNNKITLRK